MPKNQVCLFFYVRGEFLIHGCELADAEHYGDFLIYPESHWDVWEKHYAAKYGVDFDFFPRGRVAYRTTDQTFLLYYDRCLEEPIQNFIADRYDASVQTGYDEHYQCHRCNRNYVI